MAYSNYMPAANNNNKNIHNDLYIKCVYLLFSCYLLFSHIYVFYGMGSLIEGPLRFVLIYVQCDDGKGGGSRTIGIYN